jgi:hypothetical protein
MPGDGAQMLKRFKINSANPSSITTKQAREDVTAMLLAKLVADTTGNQGPLSDTLEMLVFDPERMATCLLTMTNTVEQCVNHSGRTPDGLQKLVDFLVGEVVKASR